MRLDKWLWHARFFKTRAMASRAVASGQVRVNASRVEKPATAIRIGDALTFSQGRVIRVVRVLGLGVRRGPAPEAQALYEDLAPPEPPRPRSPAPDRRARRAAIESKRASLE